MIDFISFSNIGKIQRMKQHKKQKEYRERQKIYMEEYNQRPQVKKRKKDFDNLEINKKKRKVHRMIPHVWKKELEKKRVRNKKSENRIKINEYKKKYEKEKASKDINYLIRSRIRKRISKLIRRYFQEGRLPNKVDKQINWIKVCKHLEKTKPENWKEYHIDHIKPLCTFDLTNKEELKQANHYTNLQWLPAEENLKKGRRY